MSVDQIVSLSQSVAKAHERVEKMKQELQYILDFSGVGYCSISFSSKQRTVSIDFGQLMEMYEDSLLPALQYVAEQRVKQAEEGLEEAAAKLREQIQQEEAELEVSKVKLTRELQEARLNRQIEIEKAETEAAAQRAQAGTITAGVLELRRIENERLKLEKWNGVLPTTVMGENTTVLKQLP